MREILFTITFIIACFNSAFSQTTLDSQIINRDNNKPIDLATISIKDKRIGTYSNQDGEFVLKNVNTTDTLVISHIAFKKKLICISDIPKDGKILLQSKRNEIREICIRAHKTEEYEIGDSKGWADNSFATAFFGNEIITLITNNEIKDAYIKDIIVRVTKKSNIHSYLRTHLYVNNNNKPGREIFCKNNVHEIKNAKRRLYLDISENNIIFPKEGLFVGIEWLGQTLDRKNGIRNNEVIQPRIKISNKKTKNKTYFRRFNIGLLEFPHKSCIKSKSNPKGFLEPFMTPMFGLTLIK